MKRLLVCMLLVGVVGCGQGQQSGTQTGDENGQISEGQKKAIAALEKLRAEIEMNASGKVGSGDLRSTSVSDADLEHLEGFSSLVHLSLEYTEITDAGLMHLRELTSLSQLWMDGTKITDAGLMHLKGLMLYPKNHLLR